MRTQVIEWHTVAEDGMPPTDMETVYIGRNGNGYCGCFNHVAPTGTCLYLTAEESIVVMSPLSEWAKVST